MPFSSEPTAVLMIEHDGCKFRCHVRLCCHLISHGAVGRQAAGLAGTRYGYDLGVKGEALARAADQPAIGVDQLRDQLRSTLAPFVEGHRTCALVDFPDHSNVGDSAIWLGSISWLSEAGLRIGYRCDPETYNPHHLERFVPAGPIFINGGGNLGMSGAGITACERRSSGISGIVRSFSCLKPCISSVRRT